MTRGEGEEGEGGPRVYTGCIHEAFPALPQPFALRPFRCFPLRLPRATAASAGGFAGAERGVLLVRARLRGERVASSSAACADVLWCSVEIVWKMVEDVIRRGQEKKKKKKLCRQAMRHS